jgi:hypothetical protein
MGIGPGAPPTFGATFPHYKSLGRDIITDLANITGEDLEMLGEEASMLLGRFELLLSKAPEFVEGVLEMRGPFKVARNQNQQHAI